MGLEVAETFEFDELFWFNVHNTQVKDYLKLFHAFTIVDTSFFVCFNNVVSTFDIIKKMWVDHFIMDDFVYELLRTES